MLCEDVVLYLVNFVLDTYYEKLF